jgi:hypothetical protein
MRWQDNRIIYAVLYQSIVLVVSIVHFEYLCKQVGDYDATIHNVYKLENANPVINLLPTTNL